MSLPALDNIAEALIEASCETPETAEEALEELGLHLEGLDLLFTPLASGSALGGELRASAEGERGDAPMEPALQRHLMEAQRRIDALSLQVERAVAALDLTLERLEAQKEEIDTIKRDLGIV